MMQWIHDWLAGWAWRLGHLTQARGTWLVVALILGIHGLVEATGGVQHAAQWYLTFGLRRTEVVAGALWQVGSYALLHGNWLHALVNGLCVLVLGSRVEYLLGTSGFFKTLAGGVIGGVGRRRRRWGSWWEGRHGKGIWARAGGVEGGSETLLYFWRREMRLAKRR